LVPKLRDALQDYEESGNSSNIKLEMTVPTNFPTIVNSFKSGQQRHTSRYLSRNLTNPSGKTLDNQKSIFDYVEKMDQSEQKDIKFDLIVNIAQERFDFMSGDQLILFLIEIPQATQRVKSEKKQPKTKSKHSKRAKQTNFEIESQEQLMLNQTSLH